MSVVKNKSTEENREFWSHVEAVAEEVKKWPNWTKSVSPNNKEEEREPAIECPATKKD